MYLIATAVAGKVKYSHFHQATCQFTSGVWSCVCPEGYEGDGLLCYGNAAVVSPLSGTPVRKNKDKTFKFKRKKKLLARMPLKCSLPVIYSRRFYPGEASCGSQIFFRSKEGNFYLAPPVYCAVLASLFLPFCPSPVPVFPNEQIIGPR